MVLNSCGPTELTGSSVGIYGIILTWWFNFKCANTNTCPVLSIHFILSTVPTAVWL